VFLVLCFLLCSSFIRSQNLYKCAISTDSLLLGNTLEIIYSVENGQVQFEGPDMKGLPLYAGPQISRSMSIINGKTSSVASYSYLLRPQAIGVLTIPPAYFIEGKKIIEIPPFEILVLPNPEQELQPRTVSKEIFSSTEIDSITTKYQKITKKKKKRL
jgi:hypothetical protein